MDYKYIKGRLCGTDTYIDCRLRIPAVGKGGNAHVFSAHIEDGTGIDSDNCIVKLLYPSVGGFRLCEDDERIYLQSCGGSENADAVFARRRQLMINEAAAMHELQPEGVCMNISAVFEYKGSVGVVMPIAGGTVLGNTEHSPVTCADDLLVHTGRIKQLCARISVLHEKHLLHMDISPDNLFLKRDGTLCLLDLGSICREGEAVSICSRKRGFSAPEAENMHAAGIEPLVFGYETDIYSIGAVFYNMIFGKCFDRRSPGAYYFDEINTLQINQGAKEQLKRILKSALAFTRSLRCRSVGHLLDGIAELERLLQGAGVSEMRIYQRSIEYRAVFKHTAVDDRLFAFDSMPGESFIKKLVKEKTSRVLCGGSGTGKTLLLLCMWDILLERRHTSGEGVIPLYISLSEYPEYSDRHGGDFTESYILRRICIDLFGCASLSACPADMLNEVNALLSGKKGSAEYCLLIDGLDDVGAQGRGFIIDELSGFAAIKGIRILLASRYDDPLLEGFRTSNFTGIADKDIFAYLRGHGIAPAALAAARENRSLMRLLNVPLELVLSCHADIDFEHIARRGQLMYGHFSSRAERGSEYNRLRRLSHGRGRATSDGLSFIHDRLLPYISYRMEQSGNRIVCSSALQSIIGEALDDPCGYFCSETFLSLHPEYADVIGSLYDASTVRRRISCCNEIIFILCRVLCIMQKNDDGYSFTSRAVGEFFAALHICAALDDCACSGELSIIDGLQLSAAAAGVLDMIGDILYAKCSDTPVRLLALIREKAPDSAALTAFVIEVLKAQRGCLDNIDLSGLDLTRSRLYGVSCENADMSGAMVSDSALFGMGDNIYAGAYSGDSVLLFSGSGQVVVLGSSGEKHILLPTEGDMCIAAAANNGRIVTLSRSEGRLGYIIETYTADGEPLYRVSAELPLYDHTRQYSGVKAAFSENMSCVVIANSPVFAESVSDVLIIGCESGSISRAACSESVCSVRIIGDTAYLKTKGGVTDCINIITADVTRIPCPPLDIIRIGSDVLTLTKTDDGVYLEGNERQRLLISERTARRARSYTLCADYDRTACFVDIGIDEVGIMAYFDGSPERIIYGKVLDVLSPDRVVLAHTDKAYLSARRFAGLYDTENDAWLCRIALERGMSSGSVCGRNVLMTRGGDAVLCNMDTGHYCAVCLPEKSTRCWPYPDGNGILCVTESGRSLTFTQSGGSSVRIEAEKGCRLSALCPSENMDSILIQEDCCGSKSFFIFDIADEERHELTVTNDVLSSVQAQIMPDGAVLLLGESKSCGAKRDILQLVAAGEILCTLDVSECRCTGAKLLLMQEGGQIWLVSFDESGSRDKWRYGCAVVTEIARCGELCIGGQNKYECCCVTNPRVDCRAVSTAGLVIKKRYSGGEYQILDVRTGELRDIYIGLLRLGGCKLSGIRGLSETAAELLRLGGCEI